MAAVSGKDGNPLRDVDPEANRRLPQPMDKLLDPADP